MPDSADDLNQLDLQSLPPAEAAKLIRAHAAALRRMQEPAIIGMQSDIPEMREASKAEYEQASKERGANRELAPQVLRQTLEKTSQERQLAALQQQIEYQRGQLGLQGQQLGLEGQRLNLDLVRPLMGPLLESQSQLEKLSGLANILGISGTKLAEIVKMPAEARIKAIQDALGMAQQAKGGQVPKSPNPSRMLPKTMAGSPPGPAGAIPAPTHYRYNKDKSLRVPSDAAGNPLGPPEPNR